MAAIKRRAQGEPGDLDDNHLGAQLQHKRSHGLSQADGTRAAQYVQHVTALNSQFTSWVHQQLKERPDEIWQEGLQDYLRHASKILEDFKDVAGSYKAYTGSNVQSPVVTCPQSVGGYASGSSGSKLSAAEKSSISYGQPMSNAMSLSTSMPSSSLPMLNIPGQASATTHITASDGQEDDDASNDPSSPSLKRMEEPGIKVVYEVKCKLYIKEDVNVDSSWKDMGVGNLTLKCKEGTSKRTKDAKATILVRNDVGRVLLNALLYPNMKMNIQKSTVTGIFHSAQTQNGMQDGKVQENNPSKARLYLFRLKTPDEAEKLVDAITVNAPAGQ